LFADVAWIFQSLILCVGVDKEIKPNLWTFICHFWHARLVSRSWEGERDIKKDSGSFDCIYRPVLPWLTNFYRSWKALLVIPCAWQKRSFNFLRIHGIFIYYY
jgi:hypothetical protein